MKKQAILAVVLAVILVIAAASFYIYQRTHITLGENSYPLDVTELDLSGQPLPEPEKLAQLTNLETMDLRDTGMTLYQYDTIQAALPDCEILWLVPFQGGFLENTVEEITLTQFSGDDISLLNAYFPRLKKVDGTGCPNYLELHSLANVCPSLEVSYLVPLGDQMLPQDTESIETAAGFSEYEMLTAIDCLPQLQTVTVTGTPDKALMRQLKETRPAVNFEWSFDFFGQTVSSNAVEVELNNISIDSAETLEEEIACFNALEKLIVIDSGLPSEELDALWKRHPETRLIWNVKVGHIDLRTDTTTLMPWKHGYKYQDRSTRIYDKDCKEMKYLVDMVCMDFGHQWITDISFCKYMPNLEYFLFCENGVKDLSPLAGLQKLKYLEPFSNPIEDITPLTTCPALVDLNLSYVRIEDITPLLQLQCVENLWLSAHYFDDAEKQQIQDAYPNTNIVFHSMRSTGFGWRELPNYYAQRDLLGMHYMTTSLYDPDKK